MVLTQTSNNFNTESVLKACPMCNGDHSLSNCTQFLDLSKNILHIT